MSPRANKVTMSTYEYNVVSSLDWVRYSSHRKLRYNAQGVAGIVKSVTKSDRVEKYPHLSLEVCTYVRTFCLTIISSFVSFVELNPHLSHLWS